MKIGAVYPQIELGGDPAAVRRFGTAMEELGFDHIVAYDHVLGAVHENRVPPLTGPYTEHDPFHDPLVMFAYLAAITERIELITGVLILPQRQTALVARQAADVDLLSGGRLRLGVGIGWSPVEYEALGQDFHTRGRRQEEQIGLLRTLFAEPVVDFTGEFDRIDRAALLPRPSGKIPIWLGGGPAAMKRAARVGDGFIFIGGRVENYLGPRQQLVDDIGALGRSVDDFSTDYVLRDSEGLESLVAQIDTWREAGGTHLSIQTMGLGLDTVDAHLEYLEAASKLLGLA